MVKTRAEVKIKIGEWIEEKAAPFTTDEIKNDIQKQATNIRLSPNRMTKFIRASGKAEFDQKTDQWIPRVKPLKR